MRISRIFVDQALEDQQQIQLPDKSAHYLLKVLRLKPGAMLVLFNGDGYDYAAELIASNKKTATIEIHHQSDKEEQAGLNIHLGIGLSKGDRMDLALQKATELGVSVITPLFTEYTTIKYKAEQLDKKISHWQGIIQSACEQSGRRYLPTLQYPATLQDWAAKHEEALKLVLTPQASAPMSDYATDNKLVLLIGPEGGLSEKEIRQIQQQDFHAVRLGPHVLRTETAPLAAIAAAQMLWGYFR